MINKKGLTSLKKATRSRIEKSEKKNQTEKGRPKNGVKSGSSGGGKIDVSRLSSL